jgi:hypothetical protein
MESRAKKVTKRGRNGINSRKKRAIANAGVARAATLSMKVNNSGFFSKKDLTKFIDTFFPEKNPLPYSRLQPLQKLLTCQYVMHNEPNSNLQSFPLVFRLSPELASLDDSYLKKKIQRKLSTALSRSSLFWFTTEYDTHTETRGKHLNGEILLYPAELKKCEQAFKELFGLHDKDPTTGQTILNKDGTPKQKKALRFAIDFPIDSRVRQIREKGEFYAVYNWPVYAMKQKPRRELERHLTKRSDKAEETFHYVSEELNKLASSFHSQRVSQ